MNFECFTIHYQNQALISLLPKADLAKSKKKGSKGEEILNSYNNDAYVKMDLKNIYLETAGNSYV